MRVAEVLGFPAVLQGLPVPAQGPEPTVITPAFLTNTRQGMADDTRHFRAVQNSNTATAVDNLMPARRRYPVTIGGNDHQCSSNDASFSNLSAAGRALSVVGISEAVDDDVASVWHAASVTSLRSRKPSKFSTARTPKRAVFPQRLWGSWKLMGRPPQGSSRPHMGGEPT